MGRRGKGGRKGSEGGGEGEGEVYWDRGHLLQECLEAFGKGYEYFRAASDDVRIGKTVGVIAEVCVYLCVCMGIVFLKNLFAFPNGLP